MKKNWRQRRSGQAAIEFALVAPVLIALALGIFDLGRFIGQQSIATSMAYAGIQEAAPSSGSGFANISSAIVTEANNASVPNTSAAWGAVYPGGLDDCKGGHVCGDPSQCASSYFSGSIVACFSYGDCASVGSSCNPGATWGTLTAPPAAGAVAVIKVVIKFTPITPFVKSVAGAIFYLNSTQEQEITT